MQLVKSYSLMGASVILGLCAQVITASACPEASPDYHDGGATVNVASSNPTGVSASISSDDPFICSDQGIGGFSTAYVMLESSTGNSWAQVGWLVDPYNTGSNEPVQYSQWEYDAAGNSTPGTVIYGSNGTQTQTFEVMDNTRNQSYGGFINFSANGVYLGHVYWNNVFGKWSCDGFEYSGEVGDTGDQMPGTTTSPVKFSSILYSSWHSSGDFTGTAQPNLNSWYDNLSTSGQYNNQYSSQGSFTIWDTRSTAK